MPDPAYRVLTAIVPVFNERNTVSEVLRRMRRVVLPPELDLEVIVVDDGSTDGTDKVLATLEDSTVRVLRHPTNLGKGAAIRTALAAARGDLILIQDGDLEYDPAEWPSLLKPILSGRADVVYGSRFGGTGSGMPLGEWVGNRLLSLVASVLYNTTLSDLETCYKVMDRSVLEKIDIKADGFEVEPEITAKLLKGGYRIFEVPVSFSARPAREGKKFRNSDSVKALLTLVRLRFVGERG